MKKGITLKPLIVFILVGACCWYIAGWMTIILTFNYADRLVLDKAGMVWSLCGAIVGLTGLIYFVTRPRSDWCPPPMPMPLVSTVAEAKTGLITMLLSLLIGGILLPIFFLPSVGSSNTLPVPSILKRILVGCIANLVPGSAMSPISFWLVAKILRRE